MARKRIPALSIILILFTGILFFSGCDEEKKQLVKPSLLSADLIDPQTVQLTWRDNSTTEDGCVIERSVNGGGFVTIETTQSNVKSFLDTTIDDDMEYAYRVYAFEGNDKTGYSNTVTINTESSAPESPDSLIANQVSSISISLSWTDNADNEVSFVIERKSTGDFAEVESLSANTTDWQDTALAPSTEYTYRIKAVNTAGSSPWSETATASTGELPLTVPDAPGSVTATPQSSNTIRLAWTDNADNEVSFVIERKTTGDFAEVESLNANTTIWIDTSLAASTEYTYRIKAVNTSGNSDWSDSVTAATLASGQLKYIADHTVAKEVVLRSIPESAINNAKQNLHIMYCGTSHSSQTRDGMNALQTYKAGDSTLFSVTFNGEPENNSLDMDYRPGSPVDVYSEASDLSHDGVDSSGNTQYYHKTIEYLDHAEHSDVNVVMWSWCSIDGHNVQTYLNNFDKLIEMYKAGGSKGRTSDNSVTFVWMTGYAIGNQGTNPDAGSSPYVNHKAIVDHCIANNYFCLDYWSHDTHDYETDELYPYAQGNSPTHLLNWMNAHPGEWYECNPAHAAEYDLLGNRRAYAAWWLWARIAGWNGTFEDAGL
jgi:hypothetical protein